MSLSTSSSSSFEDDDGSGSDNVSANVAVKWSFFKNNMIVGSKENISLKGNGGLDDVITYLVDDLFAQHIIVYSGVHGTPHGMLQIDDPAFAQDDVDALAQSDPDLLIEVKLVDFVLAQQQIPPGMKADLDDPNVCVVLGWCNSKYYLDFMGYKLQ